MAFESKTMMGTQALASRGRVGPLPEEVRLAAPLVAGVFMLLLVVGWVSSLVPNALPINHTFTAPHTGDLLQPFVSGDAQWYLHIAAHGYGGALGGKASAFFPLVPLLVAVVARTFTFGNYEVAGVLVSVVATVAALALLYRLVREELGELVARRSVWLLAVAPTAFFFAMAYTEGVFLVLSVGVFVLARRERFGWAGVVAALAALTREQGMLLLVPLLMYVWIAWRATPERRLPALLKMGAVAVLPTVIALGGLVAYFHAQGLGLGPWTAESAIWGVRASWPGAVLVDSVKNILGGTQSSPGEAVSLLAVLLTLVALPGVWRRLPRPYGVYTAVSVALLLVHESGGSPLMSADRFLVVVFPLFVVLAMALKTTREVRWMAAMSGVLMCGLFAMNAWFSFVG